MDVRKLGSAGVFVEHEAHTKTLELLRRAKNILRTYKDPKIDILLHDIAQHCPVLNDGHDKHFDEPYEGSGFGD